ncbi:DUF6318 family protein [Marihabitans asiaticum]|uniref:DUF6318 domain-containing protein n=1 Tax=Marihabitans asiaticum TaxID=415218 RepID=A0A560WHV6_9MICO|nr:DUF6318 family protein [Marihabitans asiaticum]TWD17273.1 hypothetical protein FB557_0840 [Marihabitans asiaticum]
MARRVMCAVALVGAVVLAGCGGEADGEETSSTSTVKPTVVKPDPSASSSGTSGPEGSSGSASGSSSPALPDEPPAEAEPDTKEGAQAFAVWYWQQMGEAEVTGSGRLYRRYSAHTCEVCRDSADRSDAQYEGQYRARSNPFDVRGVETVKDQGEFLSKVAVAYEDYAVVNPSGDEQTVEGDEFHSIVTIRRERDDWVVVDWLITE